MTVPKPHQAADTALLRNEIAALSSRPLASNEPSFALLVGLSVYEGLQKLHNLQTFVAKGSGFVLEICFRNLEVQGF